MYMTAPGNPYLANSIDQVYAECTPIGLPFAVRCCADAAQTRLA
eukprot:SAG31_NODE_45458_length_258_cov_1.949686_1_plen_43_part_01